MSQKLSKWFAIPPKWLPWPKKWRRLYVCESHPSIRWLGPAEYYYDGPIPVFGFWFFHITLDY